MTPGSVSAVLLAAGESRRMGLLNKLVLPVDGLPLVRHMAGTLLDSRLHEIVVVLGHEAEQVRPLLAGLPLNVVVNPHYRDGQMSSVHAGLAALSHPCDGVMIVLADQPLLEPVDIDRLIAAYADRRQGDVLVPTHRGARGNPIILAWEHRHAILNGDRKLGCKRFIEDNPGLVSTVEMDTDHVVFDLDTPADLDALRGRLRDAREPSAGAYA